MLNCVQGTSNRLSFHPFDRLEWLTIPWHSKPHTDWSKRQNPPKLVPESSSSRSTGSASSNLAASAQPSQDFSLKAGETISIKLGGVSTKKKVDPAATKSSGAGGGGGGLGGFMLPPPPPAPPRGR